MSDNALERMLQINTRLEKGEVENAQPKRKSVGQKISSQSELDQLIEGYDQAVYGQSQEPIIKNPQQKPYNAWEENEHLKEIAERGGRAPLEIEKKHIPRQILESIINNPLEMTPYSDSNIDKLTERIDGKMPGIKASMDLLNKIDKREKEEKEKINENLLYKKSEQLGGNVDYNKLTEIIESVIDRKLDSIKTSLNESISKSVNSKEYIPSMKVMNFKDKFYFVDTDNNVFECEMKYKGKQKSKK